MKSTLEQLKSRGYVEDADIALYLHYDKDMLIELLSSKVATERTIAVRLLTKFKDSDILDALIVCLSKENKLYTKIAVTESIAGFGKEACVKLIPLLGRIGTNQHKTLPTKPFNKQNYPLPRDIVARTICKIGVVAIKPLCECLKSSEYHRILEAIDAIGFISYYHNDYSSLGAIVALRDMYKDDALMVWNILRALQSFPRQESIELLNGYTTSDVMQHRWEAQRSLEQIEKNAKVL